MLEKIAEDRRRRQIERTRGGSQVSRDHIGQLWNIILLVIRDADIMSGELHISNTKDVTPAGALFRKWASVKQSRARSLAVSNAPMPSMPDRYRADDKLLAFLAAL